MPERPDKPTVSRWSASGAVSWSPIRSF